MDILYKPWPWYVAGPIVGLTVPALLLFGNKVFGLSSSLRHICAACMPAKIPFFTYDWKKDDWTAIPLGVKLAKLVKFGQLPVQFSGAYEYNFVNDYVSPVWAVNFTVKFLFPLN